MKNYYIADLHFGHERILSFDNRPFLSEEEMEQEQICRWNAVVEPGDTVYIIGDFCWKVEADWLRILAKLKGNKVLIKGNHDLKRVSDKLKKQFQDVRDIKIIMDGKYSVVMCHYPLMFYPHDHYENSIMLCGHVHLTAENKYLEEWRARLHRDRSFKPGNCGNIINVGCMMPYMDYTPRTLDEILAAVPIWEKENEDHTPLQNDELTHLSFEIQGMETLAQRDKKLEQAWERFADVPMNPKTEKMDEAFLFFPAGTQREDIWHWFDERHSKGISHLLYGEN